MKKPKKPNLKPPKVVPGQAHSFKAKRSQVPLSKSKRGEKSSSKSKGHPVITAINGDWFRSEFKRAGLSGAYVARAIGKDPSQISLTLEGRRRLQSDEAVIISGLIKQPLDIVLMNAGSTGAKVKITDSDIVQTLRANEGSKSIEVQGFIGSGLIAQYGVPKGPRLVDGLLGLEPGELTAMRIQTSGTSFQGLDGALVYFKPLKSMDQGALGKLSMVETNDGEILLRVARRAYTPGRYDLELLDGTITHSDIGLKAISAVLWLKL